MSKFNLKDAMKSLNDLEVKDDDLHEAPSALDATPDAASPSQESSDAQRPQEMPSLLVAEQRRHKELLVELQSVGLKLNGDGAIVSSQPADDVTVRELRTTLERISADLAVAECAKRELQPTYNRLLLMSENKERAELLKQEIHDEETRLRYLDSHIRVLDDELSAVSAQYKKKREHREQFMNRVQGMTAALCKATTDKIQLTSSVDDESDTKNFVNPADCIEVSGHLTTTRERQILNIGKQVREAQSVCEFKGEEATELSSNNKKFMQSLRESKDEEIRSLVYGLQEERNKLLADIEELITTTSDQSLNLRVGHVHTSVKDSLVFRPAPSMTSATSAGTRAQPSNRSARSASGTAANPSTRKTSFRSPNEPTDELRFLAKKNKEMLSELAVLKAEVGKASSNRTESIQVVKKLEFKLKKDKEQFETILQKFDAQIYAEQAATKTLEKENSKLADAIEQLSMVVRANKKHIEHCRAKTVPLPIE